MNKIKEISKKYTKSVVLVAVLLLGGAYFVFGRAGTKTELYTVKRSDVTQSVVLSGKVQTSDRADLGFASSGRLANIFVKNNQTVKSGAVLAQLEIDELRADLKIKEANLRASDVDLQSAKDELIQVIKQEDTKVESAYRKLLSSDLELTPEENNYTVSAPVISGLYDSTSEGQYKIQIDKKNVTFEDFRVQTFGLERSEKTINEKASTPLGTKGLYISFANSNLDAYFNTTWYLDIPNKSGASYLANFNAYNEAKRGRDVAIQNAQAKYKKLLTEGESGSATIAQAEVQKINAEIRKNTIYAPFDGRVTNIEKEVGENASLGEQVISILGESKLEVVLQVSELDVSRIPADSPIKLTLDAFPGETFNGVLKTINSKDTTIDGVPVYEAFVELASDPRIKTGMSANGIIILANKENVLVVPSYLITKKGEVSTVEVILADDKIESRTVTTGIIGSDSMVEIISGLNEGDRLVAKSTK